MLPEQYDYFEKLIGSWEIDFTFNATCRTIKGEWHFIRIHDGKAIQYVINLPDFELGTTIRVYNPNTHAWDVAYYFAGKIIRLEARMQDGKIVLTDIEDKTRKWVFDKIEDDNFHWQDINVRDNGEWYVKFDIYARRIK